MNLISYQEYHKFALKLNQHHFLHDENWAKVRKKMNWKIEILGFYQQKQLIGACIIHAKKLPIINQKMYYIPRGMIIDYNNQEHLDIFVKEIKVYLKKNHGFMLRIDPDIIRYPINLKREPLAGETRVIAKLTQSGFKHLGFVDNFEGTQPRLTFRICLRDQTIEQLEKNLEAKTRYSIKFAVKRGIEIIDGTSNDLNEFMRLLDETATRGNYQTRSKEFFEIILNTYQEKQLQFKFAKLNPELLIANLDQEFEEKNNELNEIQQFLKQKDVSNNNKRKLKNQQQQMQQQVDKIKNEQKKAQKIKKLYPDGLNLAGSLFVIDQDKSWYWFSASSNLYREYRPVYLLLWEYIKIAQKRGDQFFDLLGSPGDLSPNNKNHGLYIFKKGFGGEFCEFIGEFDLIVNYPIYVSFNKILLKAQSSYNSWFLNMVKKLNNKGE